jgi:hypothetical protein
MCLAALAGEAFLVLAIHSADASIGRLAKPFRGRYERRQCQATRQAGNDQIEYGAWQESALGWWQSHLVAPRACDPDLKLAKLLELP